MKPGPPGVGDDSHGQILAAVVPGRDQGFGDDQNGIFIVLSHPAGQRADLLNISSYAIKAAVRQTTKKSLRAPLRLRSVQAQGRSNLNYLSEPFL